MNNNNKIIRHVYDSMRVYSSGLSHMLVSAREYAFNVNVNMLICLCLLRFLNKHETQSCYKALLRTNNCLHSPVYAIDVDNREHFTESDDQQGNRAGIAVKKS